MVAPESTVKDASIKPEDSRVLFLICLLYFSYFMALGCLEPFLPIYFHSLGYGGTIIGLLGSITPFTTFLVAPLWGMVSDSTGSPFTVLYITAALSLVGKLLIGACEDTRLIMAMVCLRAIFSAPVKPLIDSLVMDQLNDKKLFGKMRLWSLIGTGVATSFAGRFINDDLQHSEMIGFGESNSISEYILSFWQSLTGYRFLFFAHALLHIPPFICIRCFQNLQRRREASHYKSTQPTSSKKSAVPLKEVAAYIFRDFEALFFFSLVFAMGMSAAVGENFSYVRFREVGGTGSDMGMSRLLCSIAGAIMFWYSGAVSSWLGIERVMILSFVIVALRFSLCAIMDHPYYGYAAEMLRGLVFGCFWSTATVYTSQIAPQEVRGTMLQFLNGIYNGVGRSTGALIGGKLQAEIGTKLTFSYGAFFNATLAVLLVMYTNLVKIPSRNLAKAAELKAKAQ